MADPRLAVDYSEIGAENVTYKIDDSTITYDVTKDGGSDQVGLAVTLVAATADTIELVGDGEMVLGRLVQVEAHNVATVQVAGYMQLPGGDGATLTRGKAIVGDLGADSAEGYIREVNTAQAAELGVCRGFINEPSTTTAVWVRL